MRRRYWLLLLMGSCAVSASGLAVVAYLASAPWSGLALAWACLSGVGGYASLFGAVASWSDGPCPGCAALLRDRDELRRALVELAPPGSGT